MEINTTRDIARQILRHRSFSFQEFSQRYADPTQDLGFVTREARLQDTKNRQNSIEVKDDPELKHGWNERQKIVIEYAQKEYEWAIRNGIAKEQARAVLPEGLTVSRLYMAGSLRSWIHYCELRMGNGTQKEHREIARDAWYQITAEFPSLKDTLEVV
jgi:thymidylate synthase (FAD)